MPYSAKQMIQELGAVNINVTFNFKKGPLVI